jgi:hypothetical protein
MNPLAVHMMVSYSEEIVLIWLDALMSVGIRSCVSGWFVKGVNAETFSDLTIERGEIQQVSSFLRKKFEELDIDDEYKSKKEEKS